jgi:transposase
LKKEEFACEEEAEKAVQRWIKEHPRCLLESLDISTVSCRVNGKRGRPKKGEERRRTQNILLCKSKDYT